MPTKYIVASHTTPSHNLYRADLLDHLGLFCVANSLLLCVRMHRWSAYESHECHINIICIPFTRNNTMSHLLAGACLVGGLPTTSTLVWHHSLATLGLCSSSSSSLGLALCFGFKDTGDHGGLHLLVLGFDAVCVFDDTLTSWRRARPVVLVLLLNKQGVIRMGEGDSLITCEKHTSTSKNRGFLP